MILNVECLLEHNDLLPIRAYEWDAGADLRASNNYKIRPHTAELVKTGVKVKIPKGYFGMLVSRSGHGKHRISLANRVGIIDESYIGEIMVRLENLGEDSFEIKRGDRIAQLVIIPCLLPEFIPVDSLEETDRGSNGFGSTGVK